MTSVETLDLHGLRHHQVELLVENFVLMNEFPVKIITGNSPTMKQIVQSVLGCWQHLQNSGYVSR
jgi:DNA-nicking Smr family endonuclease